MFGFCIIPILGIGYTFTAMNSLPISPAASCGIVHIANSVYTLFLNTAVGWVIDDHIWAALGILSGSIVLGNIFGVFITSHVKNDDGT